MSNQTSPSSMQAETAANLIFTLFIHVADAGESLSPREVLCLQEMMANDGWCDDAVLKAGLKNLRERYTEMWKAYQKSPFLRDLPHLSERLNELLASVADQASTLAALQRFIEHFKRNSSPTLVRLGLASLPAAKLDAFRSAEAVLSAPPAIPDTAPPSAPTPADIMPPPAATTASLPADLSIWPAATLNLASENLWQDGRIEVRCVAVIHETADVTTYVLHALKPVLFSYQPGQFVTLELDIEGKTIRRSYTLSSSPSRPYALSITVKRIPGGLVSNWLHENIQVGSEFPLVGPYGDFSCFAAPARKLLLISAGSGVTPLMSMLRWLVDTQSSADIVFINNIRTPADLIFAAELAYLEKQNPDQLRIAVIPGRVEAGQSWQGAVGRFSEDLVRQWAPDFAEREAFVCGPTGYMDQVRETLARMGHPVQRYHQESFGLLDPEKQTATYPSRAAEIAPPARENALTAACEPDKRVELVFAVSAKTVMASSDAYILDIAEEHGIQMGNSCRGGNCGSCKVRKVEGEVEMDEQTALSQDDIDAGFVLACRGRPTGRRVILNA